jgi:hypothetical protein
MSSSSHPAQVINALNNGALLRQLGYKHVLVDEFQDANEQQLELLKLLSKINGTCTGVTVIGDDDQSIYGFRWAAAECSSTWQRPGVGRIYAMWLPAWLSRGRGLDLTAEAPAGIGCDQVLSGVSACDLLTAQRHPSKVRRLMCSAGMRGQESSANFACCTETASPSRSPKTTARAATSCRRCATTT